MAHLEHVSSIIASAWKPSTAGKHSHVICEFLFYCAKRGIPNDCILPSSESLSANMQPHLLGKLQEAALETNAMVYEHGIYRIAKL